MEKTLTDEQAIALISSTICPSTTEDETARSVAKYAIFATMDSLGFNGLWLLNDFQPLLNAVYDLHSEIAPNWYSIDGIDYIIGSYDANHIVIIIESNNEFYWQTSGKHWGVEKTLVQAKANGARALSAEFTTNMPCPNDKLPDKPFNIKLYPSAHHDLIMSSTICQQLIRHKSKKETKTSTENSNKNTETEKIKETNMESVSEVIDSDIIDPEFSNTNDNDIYTQKISLENLAYSNDEDEVSNSGSNTETNECNPETENLDSNISDNNPLTEKNWTWSELEARYEALKENESTLDKFYRHKYFPEIWTHDLELSEILTKGYQEKHNCKIEVSDDIYRLLAVLVKSRASNLNEFLTAYLINNEEFEEMLETVKNFNTKHPAGDGDFFIKLITLRSLLPGCSFTEPMIHRICRNLPTTKEEFTKSTELDIDECEPFFEDFLMVIRDYLNKRNDPQKENDEEKSNTNNNDTDNPIDEQIEKTTLETKIQADTLGIVEEHSRMHKCSDFFEKAFIETVFGEPSETDTSNNEENSSNSTTYADSEETSIPSSIPEQITSQTGHIAPANDSEPVLQETPIYGLDKTWSELTELANAEKEEYKNNLLNEDTDKRLTMRLRVLIENIKKNGKFLALWGVTPEDISLFRPKSEIALYIHCHFDKNDAEEYGQQFIDEINDYEAHPYNDTSALYDYLQAAKKILPDCYCNEYMLWTIATNRPHTKDELLTLQGIGKITCDRFGNTLLAVINEFEKRHPPLETNNEIIDDNLETPSTDASDALDDNNIETFDESIADAEEDKAESESQSVDFNVYEDFDPTFNPTEDLDIDDTPAFNADNYDTNFNFTPNGEDTTSDSAENDAPDFDIDPDMEE